MQTNKGRVTKDGIRIYEADEFAGMNVAGRLAAQILDDIAAHVFVGQTTAEVDRLITQMVVDAGATSATIGYKGYQHASCISINHVVCHGIPGEKQLKDGDIVNIDVTVIVDGWFGDTSRMYVVGKLSRKAERLIQVTHDALMMGIEAAKPGNTFGDIGHAIQVYAESQRMSVVRDFCGHGLGRVFHSPPNVLHYGRAGTGAGDRAAGQAGLRGCTGSRDRDHGRRPDRSSDRYRFLAGRSGDRAGDGSGRAFGGQRDAGQPGCGLGRSRCHPAGPGCGRFARPVRRCTRRWSDRARGERDNPDRTGPAGAKTPPTPADEALRNAG